MRKRWRNNGTAFLGGGAAARKFRKQKAPGFARGFA